MEYPNVTTPQVSKSRKRRMFRRGYESRLAWSRNANAAKARKRMANPVDDEPRMVRWHRLQFGVRDKLTGDSMWMDLCSVRDAARRLSVLLRHYR